MDQNIINRLNALSDKALLALISDTKALRESSMKYYINELENRKLTKERDELVKRYEAYIKELEKAPSVAPLKETRSNSTYNIVEGIIAFIKSLLPIF